jgi:hypothetical protein
MNRNAAVYPVIEKATHSVCKLLALTIPTYTPKYAINSKATAKMTNQSLSKNTNIRAKTTGSTCLTKR